MLSFLFAAHIFADVHPETVGGVCAHVCVCPCERTDLLTAVTNCRSCRIQLDLRSGKGINSYINWHWKFQSMVTLKDSKVMNGNRLALCGPQVPSANRLVSFPLPWVSTPSDTTLCWAFCHNWNDFALPSRLGFSNSELISSPLLFSHPTLVPLLSHIAGVMVVVMWILASAALGCWGFFSFLSYPWFSWLQKWMAQEKAGRAGGQMRGKRGFLVKAGNATRGQALPHLAPGRSCTFLEHTGLSPLPFNLWKWHPHPASQHSAQALLYKRHCKIIFKHCTVPLARVRTVRGLWRLLSFHLFLLCLWLYCDLFFMATFQIFQSLLA